MHQCSLGLLLPVGVELGFCEQGCARIPGYQSGGGRRGWGRASKVANCATAHSCLSCSARKKCPQSRGKKALNGDKTRSDPLKNQWHHLHFNWASNISFADYFCFMKPTIQFDEEVCGSPRISATLCILIVGQHGICQFSYTSKIPKFLKRFLRIFLFERRCAF